MFANGSALVGIVFGLGSLLFGCAKATRGNSSLLYRRLTILLSILFLWFLHWRIGLDFLLIRLLILHGLFLLQQRIRTQIKRILIEQIQLRHLQSLHIIHSILLRQNSNHLRPEAIDLLKLISCDASNYGVKLRHILRRHKLLNVIWGAKIVCTHL